MYLLIKHRIDLSPPQRQPLAKYPYHRRCRLTRPAPASAAAQPGCGGMSISESINSFAALCTPPLSRMKHRFIVLLPVNLLKVGVTGILM